MTGDAGEASNAAVRLLACLMRAKSAAEEDAELTAAAAAAAAAEVIGMLRC